MLFHPSWHALLELSVGEGVHPLPWERPPGDGGYVARAALAFLVSQTEAGHFCPISMTTSAVPTLRLQPELAAEWEPLLVSRRYDRSDAAAAKKTGVMMGMGMTEKQGGSDVRANTTLAEPVGGRGDEFLLTGHKWFLSAPMSDAFCMLAQTTAGLTCFLVPRFTPDGERNRIHPVATQGQDGESLQRLGGGGARPGLGAAGGSRGKGGGHHHRDGLRDPTRLRGGIGGPDAAGGHPGDPPHGAGPR